MKIKGSLSAEMYGRMLDHLNTLHLTDQLGHQADLSFLKEDQWLCDSVVIDRVTLRRGTWEIDLVFAHVDTPLKFLTRRITSQTCPRRAVQMAGFMRRLAAKDQRGTLELNTDTFVAPLN